MSRADAIAIWTAGVDAVRPARLIDAAFDALDVASARRVLVVGAGKAGAGMAEALEARLGDALDRTVGWVNVPAPEARPLRRITLHPARPAGSNSPTAEGVAGSEEILKLVTSADEETLTICLISGGGSALLPAPVEGVTLADKQSLARAFAASGASIGEINAVRKHLSRVKGGRLAQASPAGRVVTFVLSDVVGDPLDVIASGPTVPDPTTFGESIDILRRFRLWDTAAPGVRRHLERGAVGGVPETPKVLPERFLTRVIGNGRVALDAAAAEARRRGYGVLDLGAFVEGDTVAAAGLHAAVVRSVRRDGKPASPPLAILSGGETTVALPERPGVGGRNQAFALSMLEHFRGVPDVVALSGGTDGEDGPTDAAGGIADAAAWEACRALGLSPADALARADAYPLLRACGGLFQTGLTGTNVMDLRVVLVTDGCR